MRLRAVGKLGRRAAIAPGDRLVFAIGQVAVLVDALEIGDLDIRQMRHVPGLMPEPVGDLRQDVRILAGAVFLVGVNGSSEVNEFAEPAVP